MSFFLRKAHHVLLYESQDLELRIRVQDAVLLCSFFVLFDKLAELLALLLVLESELVHLDLELLLFLQNM